MSIDTFIVFGGNIEHPHGGMEDAKFKCDTLEPCIVWVERSGYRLYRKEMNDEALWCYIYDVRKDKKVYGFTRKEAIEILEAKCKFRSESLYSYLVDHGMPPIHWFKMCGESYKELTKLADLPKYVLDTGNYYILDVNKDTLEHDIIEMNYDKIDDIWSTVSGLILRYHKEATNSKYLRLTENLYLIGRSDAARR